MQITKQLIKQFLPNNSKILEAGAHIGRDTRKMSILWPESSIYAFEPAPALFSQLVQNVQDRPNVHCFPFALSNTRGEKIFYVSSGRSTAISSLFKPKGSLATHPETHFEPTLVTCTTLDAWAQAHAITHIDFMWLDMQGAELEVLKASSYIVPTVQVMLLEANLRERYEQIPLYPEIIQWLKEQQFSVVAEDEPKHDKVNLLCVRV